MAVRNTAFDVYTENKRCVSAFETEAFGYVADAVCVSVCVCE